MKAKNHSLGVILPSDAKKDVHITLPKSLNSFLDIAARTNENLSVKHKQRRKWSYPTFFKLAELFTWKKGQYHEKENLGSIL